MIALVDCNCFYVSCELVFRRDLKAFPVAVLSNNDGCIISLNQQAKDLGLSVGVPLFQVKSLVNSDKLIVFSANFILYSDMSRRVMRTLEQFSPKVEVYSIDEAFLDLSGQSGIEAIAATIKRRIQRHQGIPVGVGIGATKVLAKLANRLAKKLPEKKGIVVLENEEQIDWALAQTGIEDVWGIGSASTHKMKNLGIKTAKDLRDFSNEKLIQKIFTKVGLQIKHELMGIRCFSLLETLEKKKQMMFSRTLAESSNDLIYLQSVIAQFITELAFKLRSQNSLCQEVSLFGRWEGKEGQDYFYQSKLLATPCDDTLQLIQVIQDLLRQELPLIKRIKKIGVSVARLSDATGMQFDFFTPAQQKSELMEVMDKINRIYKGGLKSAACGTSEQIFKMNRQFKSPTYTTNWDELKKFN